MTTDHSEWIEPGDSKRLVEWLLAVGMRTLQISDAEIDAEPSPVVQELMTAIVMLDEDLEDREAELATTELKLQTLVNTVDDGLAVCDLAGVVLWANPVATQLCPCLSPGDLIDPACITIPTATHAAADITKGPRMTAGTKVTAVRTNWGDEPGYLLWIRDLSANHDLKRGAIIDPLTELPNRVLFFDRLNEVLNSHGSDEHTVTVFFLDLDKFKEINDDHGHDVGDQILQVVARRIATHVKKQDLAARLGGDEFAIVASDLSLRESQQIAERITEAVREPIQVGDRGLSISVSVGFTRATTGHGVTADELLKAADRQMYRVKRSLGEASTGDSESVAVVELA